MHIEIIFIVGSIFFAIVHNTYSQNIKMSEKIYSSKWDRVLKLGREIKQGSVESRLWKKEEILDILLKEEFNYPIVYVDCNAKGCCDGSSWENAFHEIQPAIESLKNKEGWVWVARGIYDPIHIRSGVMVFGGFSGNESKLHSRNYSEYETIIRNKKGPGKDGPCGAVMDHKTLIDGFTIRNCGYCDYESKGVLVDSFVGGGIRTWSWFSIIRNNTIYDNISPTGSGIAVWGRFAYERMEGYAPIIERNLIYNNDSTCGAVVMHNSEALFSNNIICYNYCSIIPNKSKGVEIQCNPAESDRPIVVNSIIWGNTVRQYFPDLYNHVGYVRNHGDGAKAISLYNCIDYKGYAKAGLVEDNPLFLNAENNNFQLRDKSPCINAGYPEGPPDPDGTRADIGLFLLRYFLTIIDSSKVDPEYKRPFSPGTVVPISTDSLVVDSAETSRYLFNSWIGFGSGSYTGSVKDTSVCIDTSITEIIIWDRELRLEIETGTEADTSSGWYPEGSSITLSVPSYVYIDQGERKHFIGWQGVGKGAYTGKDTLITITIRSPIEQSAIWQNEYLLSLNSQHGFPVGEGWYQSGDTAKFFISSHVSEGDGKRYSFTEWQGEGQGSYTGTSVEVSLIINNSVTETACWETQYFLNIKSDYGNPEGQGWYKENSLVQISIDTIMAINNDTRMHFYGWMGNGYTGSNPGHLINMIEPIEETAEWNKEYWIDIAAEPAESGEVIPIGQPGGWLVSGDVQKFDVIEYIDKGCGFEGWSGYVTSTERPLSIKIQEPFDLTANFKQGSVIIKTVPSGLKFIADSTEYTDHNVFFWAIGEQHELDVSNFQVYGDTSRYFFSRWGDGKAKKHTVEATEELQRITVFFDIEYYLKVESDYAYKSISGEGWYQSGDTAAVLIDSLSADSAQTRYRFSGWTGSIESSSLHLEVCVNKPLFLNAEWVAQHFLDVKIIPESSGYVELSPEGNWYDSGTDVKLEAFSNSGDIKFIEWLGDISGSEQTKQITMEEAKEISAHFNYTLNVAPEVSKIPDAEIFEDSIYQIIISDYITDMNDPVDNLFFSIENDSHFEVEHDTGWVYLNIVPETDWFGSDSVILRVSDLWQMSDSDTFFIDVFPLDDPPGDFVLIKPEHESIISDTTEFLDFFWKKSRDVDGENITYDFIISIDSLFESGIIIEKKNLYETNIEINISKLNSTVYWRVLARDNENSTWCRNPFRIDLLVSNVNDRIISSEIKLYQNYPNPFNSSTRIVFSLLSSANIKMEVYNTCGRLVSVLADGNYDSGVHVFTWDAAGLQGERLPSGLYILRADLGGRIFQKKMTVLK